MAYDSSGQKRDEAPLIDDTVTTQTCFNDYRTEIKLTAALDTDQLVNPPWTSKVYFPTKAPWPHLLLLVSCKIKEVGSRPHYRRGRLRIAKEAFKSPMTLTRLSKGQVANRNLISQFAFDKLKADGNVWQIDVSLDLSKCGVAIELTKSAPDGSGIHLLRDALSADEANLTFFAFGGSRLERDFHELKEAFSKLQIRTDARGISSGKDYDHFYHKTHCKNRIVYSMDAVRPFSKHPDYPADTVYAFKEYDDYFSRMFIGTVHEQAAIQLIAPTGFIASRALLLEILGGGPNLATLLAAIETPEAEQKEDANTENKDDDIEKKDDDTEKKDDDTEKKGNHDDAADETRKSEESQLQRAYLLLLPKPNSSLNPQYDLTHFRLA